MNPEDQLRALKDPERWEGVRTPRSLSAEPARRPVLRFAPAVAALAIAVAAVAGIAFAFGSIPHGAPPASTGEPSAAPSTTPAAAGCGSGQLTVRTGDSASAAGYVLTTVLVANTGSACALPSAAITVGGFEAGDGWATVNGALTLPAGTSQLYLLAQKVDTTDTRVLPTKPGHVPVTLRIGDTVRLVGVFPFTGWAEPTVGQIEGGEQIRAYKLVIEAAEDADILAARATAKPKPAYTPPPSTPTPTPPVPTVACTAAQLTVTPGEFGGSTGNWIEPLFLVNSGSPCFLLPNQFMVGTYTAVGGNASTFSLQPGRSVLDVMSADACFDAKGRPSDAQSSPPVPIELTIDGVAKQIGTFTVAPCSTPFIDPA